MTAPVKPFAAAWTLWRDKGVGPVVDEKELRLWIARLECEESSWTNYEKLAALYTIKDHQGEQTEPQAAPVMYSAAPADAVEDYGDSDFLRAVSGKDPAKVWAILDELMGTLYVLNERIYNGVMRKIEDAK